MACLHLSHGSQHKHRAALSDPYPACAGLAGLPAPQYDYQISLPELPDTDMEVDELLEEDAADAAAKRRAAAKAAEEAALRKRSQVWLRPALNRLRTLCASFMCLHWRTAALHVNTRNSLALHLLLANVVLANVVLQPSGELLPRLLRRLPCASALRSVAGRRHDHNILRCCSSSRTCSSARQSRHAPCFRVHELLRSAQGHLAIARMPPPAQQGRSCTRLTCAGGSRCSILNKPAA